MKNTIALVIAALIAAPAVGAAASAKPPEADLVLVNGRVLTVDANDTIAEAIAVRGERILAVGRTRDIEALAGTRTRRIDLKGRTVTPGLIDTHAHLTGGATRERFEIDLNYPKAGSVAEVVRLVEARVRSVRPGEWIIGSGWDEGKLAEKRYLYARDIDAVSPDNPVVLVHTMGHYSVANTAALRAAGIKRETPDPPGGTIDRDANGEPTGILKERAAFGIMGLKPDYTASQIYDAVAVTSKNASTECLTAIKDPGIDESLWSNYQRLRADGKLPLRVAALWFSPSTLPEAARLIERIKPISRPGVRGEDNHVVSIGIKMAIDGSGGARTAWMNEDWNREYIHVDTGNHGYPVWDLALAAALVRQYHESGVHMGIHSIGDRGIDWTLNAYETLLKERPTQGLRHSIIHANAPTDAAIDKMAVLQSRFDAGFPEIQAPFLWWIGDTYAANLGPLRTLRLKPLKTYLDHGVRFAGGSDYPVAPLPPRYGLWASIARQTLLGTYGPTPFGTANAVDIHVALRSYTAWAARQLFMEREIGTIETGKLADLAVWDQDMYSVPVPDLKNLQCSLTVFNGQVVHERSAEKRAAQ